MGIIKIEGTADLLQVRRNRRWSVPPLRVDSFSTTPVLRNVIKYWYNRQAEGTPKELAEPQEGGE